MSSMPSLVCLLGLGLTDAINPCYFVNFSWFGLCVVVPSLHAVSNWPNLVSPL